ncbi:MAG: nucleotidyltransferase domain-containing protein [Pontiellaceae bacterium]|nr:nucleotidyltransferase domain-containing protein [Pontiellaceae bacterium]
MVAFNTIENCAQQVANMFRPEKIILFGSYAYGKPTENSDIDLLVVMNHTGSAVQQAAQIRTSIQTSVPMDVLVRSPEKVQERLRLGDPFLKTIFEKGEMLYEAANP